MNEDSEVEEAVPEVKYIEMDCDPSGWKLSEQIAYRTEVGVNAQYAMLMIGKAFEAEDAEKFTNIDPAWLLGVAWITARRKDKFVKLDKMAETLEYSQLLQSVLAWAEAQAEANPTKAPRKAPRKRS
jgi:hypothetical protein